MHVFEAIAQPTRRQILRLLSRGELTAGTVAEHFDVSQPAISQHLKALREAGLVAHRVDGPRRLYRLNPDGLGDVHDFLAEVLPPGLARLKAAAEEEERSGRTKATRN